MEIFLQTLTHYHITLLCTVKVHTIGRYNDHKESEIVPDLWNGYTVSIIFYKAMVCHIELIGPRLLYFFYDR